MLKVVAAVSIATFVWSCQPKKEEKKNPQVAKTPVDNGTGNNGNANGVSDPYLGGQTNPDTQIGSCRIGSNLNVQTVFDQHIKPIFARKCVSCHSAVGTYSQMPLASFQDVYQLQIVRQIGDSVRNGRMPKLSGAALTNNDYTTGTGTAYNNGTVNNGTVNNGTVNNGTVNNGTVNNGVNGTMYNSGTGATGDEGSAANSTGAAYNTGTQYNANALTDDEKNLIYGFVKMVEDIAQKNGTAGTPTTTTGAGQYNNTAAGNTGSDAYGGSGATGAAGAYGNTTGTTTNNSVTGVQLTNTDSTINNQYNNNTGNTGTGYNNTTGSTGTGYNNTTGSTGTAGTGTGYGNTGTAGVGAGADNTNMGAGTTASQANNGVVCYTQ